MFETRREAGVLTLARPATTWLSTGWRGGRRTADAAHWVSVPEGWNPTDIGRDVTDRLAAAGVDWGDEPVLLTGVELDHARGARCGEVVAYATAGLSNPAALPMDPGGGALPEAEWQAGTVNVALGTECVLTEGALANLVAVAAEAKAATLLHHADYPGTTTDAVLVACGRDGTSRSYSGSATRIGSAARASVREAVAAALDARQGLDETPASVADAEHGIVTDVAATVFDPVTDG
jgi:adenosylcobinamide hydrolase